jgi:hypothetical protein
VFTSPIVINSPVGGFRLGNADDVLPDLAGGAVVAETVVPGAVVPGAAVVVGAVVVAGGVVVTDVTGVADLLLPHEAAMSDTEARAAAHQRPDRVRWSEWLAYAFMLPPMSRRRPEPESFESLPIPPSLCEDASPSDLHSRRP